MFSLLLVDDNPVDRLLIVRELSREFPDLHLEEVIDVEDFNQELTAGNFDLVITDYQLRWSDGLIVLQEIKSRYPDCPVIMFSDSSTLEIVVEAMKAGLDDYIPKTAKHYVRLPIAVRSALQRAESERRAKRLEVRLQSLLNRLNVGVFCSTLDGCLLEGNASFLRILGMNSLAETQNLDWREFLQSEAELKCSNQEREVQLRRIDGSLLWIALSQTLNLTEAEPVIEGLIEDITDRKLAQEALKQAKDELESRVAERTQSLQQVNEQLLKEIRERQQAQDRLHESEEHYRQLVELCPDAIFIHSGGRFVFANSAAAQLYGATSAQELIGRPIMDIVHPDYRETVEERIRKLTEERTQVGWIEQKAVRLDGTIIDVEVAAAPFTYQQTPAAQVVVRDISDRKRLEAELRKNLEQERELSELKSRLITTISHEYRTPLTVIQSSAELLEYYEHRWSPEKKLNHLQRIQHSTSHLTRLVNDVLLIGQAEENHVEFNPLRLDLEQFCQELVEELCLSIQNQTTIAMNIRGNSTNVCLDEKLLRQILTNLLSNAMKYSPEGGTIRFDVECIDRVQPYPSRTPMGNGYEKSVVVPEELAEPYSGGQHSGFARFCIQDSGIGIPEEDQSRLFESFHRASNVGTISGTGLGLAIVKNCVDLHKGQISVNSVIGVGTTFTVTLPLHYPAAT